MLTLCRYETRRRKRRRAVKRWVIWGLAMGLLPAIAFGAYQPAVLLVANNLSDLASAATARTNLGLTGAATMTLPVAVANGGIGAATETAHGVLLGQGTAAVTALAPAADSVPLWQTATADPTVTAIANCTDTTGNHLNYSTATHAFSCGTSSTGAPTATVYTAVTTPMTLPSTNNNMEIVAQTTPAALTLNLPAVAANLVTCVKDGKNNFATNNATVAAATAIIFDHSTTAVSSVVMNQAGQEMCFISDGTSWYTF